MLLSNEYGVCVRESKLTVSVPLLDNFVRFTPKFSQ